MKILLKILIALSLFTSCNKEDEGPKFDMEVITEVTLLFSPFGDGAPVTFTALDPDGEGSENLIPLEEIVLQANTTYDLFIQLESDDENDVDEEIKNEASEHLFYFEFTDGLFLTPQGNGNVDSRAEGAVFYQDTDSEGLPLGFITTWACGEPSSGSFRIVLKHQDNGIKSESSEASDGGTDFDVKWNFVLE